MKQKVELLKKWLEEEKANAMEYNRQSRLQKDFTAALIGGTEATAFASCIRKLNEIFESECSSVAEAEKSCDHEWTQSPSRPNLFKCAKCGEVGIVA